MMRQILSFSYNGCVNIKKYMNIKSLLIEKYEKCVLTNEEKQCFVLSIFKNYKISVEF